MVSHFKTFNFRTIGRSHIKAGKVCQDYTLSADKQDLRYAVVCDGHGGTDYFRSHKGSRIAAEAFALLIENRDFLEALDKCHSVKERDRIVLQFIKSLIARWNEMVDKDIEQEPFTAEELEAISEKAYKKYTETERRSPAYGTTLIGTVLTDNYWLGIQIGDGKCVTVDESGEFSQPIPWDDKCFLNVTTSICDENAVNEFRYCFSNELPAVIFLGSDGIDDCFTSDIKLYDFYRIVGKSFSEYDEKYACDELEQFLPTLSEKGSGDDASVAAILNIDLIKDNKDIFKTGRQVYLTVTRSGNFGGDNPNDRYFQNAEILAEAGCYSLDDIDCYGFHEGTMLFTITAVAENAIELSINNHSYTVTSDQGIEIEDVCTQKSYSGASWTAEDSIEFGMIQK